MIDSKHDNLEIVLCISDKKSSYKETKISQCPNEIRVNVLQNVGVHVLLTSVHGITIKIRRHR